MREARKKKISRRQGAAHRRADDNKVNRLLLARSLEIQGHHVASAENGRVALELLRREVFDLVLLDMEMPEMDGFQVLEQLVNDRQLQDLPVIVTYALMFDAISSHGGVVTLMMGDGLMSVFGAPMQLPEHEEQAVRAAQEMVEMIALFNLERAASEKTPITIGIGIASGEMVAGYSGTNERATYTCIGDTVNLAARLETHTKVAQRAILIDQATRAALSERIAVEALGPVPFRGKSAAVEVFSVNPGQKR